MKTKTACPLIKGQAVIACGTTFIGDNAPAQRLQTQPLPDNAGKTSVNTHAFALSSRPRQSNGSPYPHTGFHRPGSLLMSFSAPFRFTGF